MNFRDVCVAYLLSVSSVIVKSPKEKSSLTQSSLLIRYPEHKSVQSVTSGSEAVWMADGAGIQLNYPEIAHLSEMVRNLITLKSLAGQTLTN